MGMWPIVLSMFQHRAVGWLIAPWLIVVGAHTLANSANLLTLATAILMWFLGIIGVMSGFYLTILDVYLPPGEKKKNSFLARLKMAVFANSKYSFMLSYADRTDMSLTEFLNFAELYKDDPKAFIGLRQITIPFTNKYEATKWKIQDPYSGYFRRISDTKFEEGLVKDVE